MDVFAEVKRIEDEAERILAEAKAAGQEAMRRAEAEAAGLREQTGKAVAAESARLRDEQGRKRAAEKAAVESDDAARKARIEHVASHGADALAAWVAARYLELNR